jgi:hypothetical protein
MSSISPKRSSTGVWIAKQFDLPRQLRWTDNKIRSENHNKYIFFLLMFLLAIFTSATISAEQQTPSPSPLSK